ncbi:MAG: serine/threonine-protein kinase [Pseudomonadota bacterium]
MPRTTSTSPSSPREEQIRDVAHAAVVRYSENNRTADGLVYLVMDYVEGPDLAHRMKEGGMSSEALLSVARRVCEGLEAVHSQNIVHRDLSPDNIILRHGEPEEAVIIDFGIAKDTTEGAITIVGNEFAGKYAYAAPEQLHGNSDHRTDLYSLGMVLLAVYNGKPPFIGNNIKEMMEIKGRRPDTEGVPEDLKGLIDRLTEPDPAHRFQSAGEVLDYIWGDDDRPRPRYTQFPGAQPAPAPKGRGLIGALAAVVVVAAIGAGLFFSGVLEPLLRPSYPAVDPYTLAARKTPGGGVTITGHAPSEEAAAAIAAQGDQMGGDVDLVLASGDIPEGWSGGIAGLLTILAPLDDFELDVVGTVVRIQGFAPTPDIRHDVARRLDGANMPRPFTGEAQILFGPRILSLDALDDVLRRNADCGPFVPVNPPADGYPIGARITVTGDVASAATRSELYDQLTRIAGNRLVVLDAEILNPSLCRIQQKLPDAPSGSFVFALGYGADTARQNVDGVYEPGDNPVIDVVLPAGLEGGYLWVAITDVSGNVFNLFPLAGAPGRVADIPPEADGTRRVRVAHPAASVDIEAGIIGFVIDETFGKSKLVALHAETPIFPDRRPLQESVQSFTNALDQRIVGDGLDIRTVDTRILESR